MSEKFRILGCRLCLLYNTKTLSVCIWSYFTSVRVTKVFRWTNVPLPKSEGECLHFCQRCLVRFITVLVHGRCSDILTFLHRYGTLNLTVMRIFITKEAVGLYFRRYPFQISAKYPTVCFCNSLKYTELKLARDFPNPHLFSVNDANLTTEIDAPLFVLLLILLPPLLLLLLVLPLQSPLPSPALPMVFDI